MTAVSFYKVSKDFYSFLNSHPDFDDMITLTTYHPKAICLNKIKPRKTLALKLEAIQQYNFKFSPYTTGENTIENIKLDFVRLTRIDLNAISYETFPNLKRLYITARNAHLIIFPNNLNKFSNLREIYIDLQDNTNNSIDITGLFSSVFSKDQFLNNIKILKIENSKLPNITYGVEEQMLLVSTLQDTFTLIKKEKE